MKKLILGVTMAAVMAAAAEMKVATVNMIELVRLHPSYETNRKLLRDTAADYRKKFEARQDALKTIAEEGKKAQEDMNNPLLSPAAKNAAQKKLEDVQARFMATQRQMRESEEHNRSELADLETRLLKLQTDEIRAKLAAYAKANGYDLILDSTVLGYAKETLDVTDAVLKAMGVDPAKRKEIKNESK